MNTEEVIEMEICGDSRIFNAIAKAKRIDTSFTQKGFLGIPIIYSQSQCRNFWFRAMTLGMQEGLRIGSIQGQRIDTTKDCKNERHKEFYNKFLKLAEEYNCAIVYHPYEGMLVMDLNNL